MNPRYLIIFFACVFFISITYIFGASYSNEEPIKFELRFQNGEIRNYLGIIEITDISGIPTEGSNFGNEDAALSYEKYSVPYTFQEEIIKVDEAGTTATILITKNIQLEDFESIGRDKATIDNIKQALKTLYLESHGPMTVEQKSNGLLQEKWQKDSFNQIITPSFPDEPMKVGGVHKQEISNPLGLPIERCWTLKEIKTENGINFAIVEIVRNFEASIPYQDIFRKVSVKDVNEITFNLDKAFVQKQEILKHIKTDLVDKRGTLLGGNARVHTIVKITEYLGKK